MKIAAAFILALPLAGQLCGDIAEPSIDRSRIVLAPSSRQMRTLPAFDVRWHIPGAMAPQLRSLLAAMDVAPSLGDELLSRLRRDPGTGDGFIVPDRELVQRFSPAELARWHELLVYHRENVASRWPLSLGSAEVAALNAHPPFSAAMQTLQRFAARHGDRLVLRDVFLLDETFRDSNERESFYRLALAGDAWLLHLRRNGGETFDAAAPARWWQVNGRHRAIEPLLNAVAAIPNAPRLDVVHLLPRLPRSLANTFPPDLGAADNPGADSGLLASEFFDLTAGVDPQAEGGLKEWLARECVPVADAPQFGDLCVFGNLERTMWPYTAVYIANGIGFARRPTLLGPWQFLELADVGRLNPRFAGSPPRIFRPKTAMSAPGEPPFLPSRMPEAWRKELRLKPLKAGPWGKLWYYEVLLAPSANTLERLPPPETTPVWKFQDLSADDIRGRIARIPMNEDVRAPLQRLFATAAADKNGHVVVHPSLDLVLAVPREFRTSLFPHLVAGESVTDYAQHIPFPAGFTIEEWFDAGSLPESVRQAILRLVYPVRDRVMLSDFGALHTLVRTKPERLSVLRAALRLPAVVLLLERPDARDVPALADYWRTGQAKGVDRFLASFAGQTDTRFLDVIHLLSPIEREFLNTYFMPAGPTRVPSCFWTAFNFDTEVPDDRFLVLPGTWSEHQRLAWQELEQRYEQVTAPSRLGDVIAYRKKQAKEVVHVSVFIADEIVLTKNGFTFSKPWCLSRMADVDELYLDSPEMERVYFRRRSPAP